MGSIQIKARADQPIFERLLFSFFDRLSAYIYFFKPFDAEKDSLGSCACSSKNLSLRGYSGPFTHSRAYLGRAVEGKGNLCSGHDGPMICPACFFQEQMFRPQRLVLLHLCHSRGESQRETPREYNYSV